MRMAFLIHAVVILFQPIDADTHKAMMAHYFKQQEQLKVTLRTPLPNLWTFNIIFFRLCTTSLLLGSEGKILWC